MSRKFSEVAVGQWFDFINDLKPDFNSFYRRCKKVSTRKYVDENGLSYRVGSINAVVYHVSDNA